MSIKISDVLKKDGDRSYVGGNPLWLRRLHNETWMLMWDREDQGAAVIDNELTDEELASTLAHLDELRTKPGDWLVHHLDERANPLLHRVGPAYVAYHSDEGVYPTSDEIDEANR
jgi:hypothetical protein